jgi:polyisoprenoid-binding protein YceI
VIGTVDVNPADAALAKIAPIRIDAGSFVTDDELRDSSVRAFILQADRYPEIVFTPTSIAGLPPAAEVGDELAFVVTGDLTIRDTTRPVVFEVTLEVQSPDRLLGRAEAAILRSDFGLTIPEVQWPKWTPKCSCGSRSSPRLLIIPPFSTGYNMDHSSL